MDTHKIALLEIPKSVLFQATNFEGAVTQTCDPPTFEIHQNQNFRVYFRPL